MSGQVAGQVEPSGAKWTSVELEWWWVTVVSIQPTFVNYQKSGN